MPLHDWADRDGWEGLHHYWTTEIAVRLRHTLPPAYRVVIGSSPLVAVGGGVVKPDVAVTNGRSEETPTPTGAIREPDFEAAVSTLAEDTSIHVERNGRLVAAIELISPRNKDVRPSARDQYSARYLSYLHGGVHLLLVDVHRRPIGFSFPQLIAAAFDPQLPAPPAPCAVVYRVGPSAATGGRMLAVWREQLTVGQPLPPVSLPLTLDLAVPIDLDGTYSHAAANCYLE